MKKGINDILKEELCKIKPEKKDIENIKKKSKKFEENLKKEIKKENISAEVFLGGSLAKDTIIKKQKEQDIDIFIRFNKKYSDREISKILEKVINRLKYKDIKKIHGSRDYFQITSGNIIYEVVPICKISLPEDARNVTDLSYFHVKYVKDKISKNKNLADGIRLAKAFSYAQNCYGAESYIQGFSGYALELLVLYYGSFLKFIKEIAKTKKKKIIIDPEKHYKDKEEILWELNESKLQSPIVFVDPTYKQRNALAALSEQAFKRFKKASKDFLKNPSDRYFERKLPDKKNFNFILKVNTKKQKGDIAGSKLKKFYEFLLKKLGKYFEIKKKEFLYKEDKNIGEFYLDIKKRDKLTIWGPPITDVNNLSKFKKKHPKAKIKNQKAISIEQNNITKEKFIKEIQKKYKDIIKDMSITKIEILQN
jgi:tRNA nucleotidyltransferase (CCA-adding enzyme)